MSDLKNMTDEELMDGIVFPPNPFKIKRGCRVEILHRMSSLRAQLATAKEALEFYSYLPNYVFPPKTGQSVGEFGSHVDRERGRQARNALRSLVDNKPPQTTDPPKI